MAKVILITGASAGIGREMALQFARRGDHVIATARRLDRLETLAQEAASLAGKIIPVEADVLNPADLQKAVDAADAQFGRLDIVIANAGLGQRGAIVDSAWEDVEAVLRINVEGALHTIRAAVPLLRKSGGGHIVMISSVLSLATGPYCAVYSAAKATINALARGLRVELRADHIWVTNVLLGQTHSEFAQVRRGQAGRVASKLPTMSAEYAASQIVRATDQRRRTITLRLIDRLIMWMGIFVPWISDRVLERFYKPH
ncbi:MAG: SDR family NAD(P)-dependent oxidoreductase [Anaerolineae bacterium]|nr:SDR family NAD(P)-dependent oxidoreductase [Anaerolineae bacterium]